MVEVSRPEVVMEEEIVVGMVDPMDTVLLPMLQLAQEVVVVGLAAVIAEEDMALALQTEMLLNQVVGMIRVADAHTKTETVATVEATAAMGIVMGHPAMEVVAIWSR